MKISVFGSGYVGLVTGACFADFGNHVHMIDIDARKVESLKKGQIPIYEPGLEDMVLRNHRAERLQFTTDAQAGLRAAEIVFVAVSTPEGEDGRADLAFVEQVAQTVGDFARAHKKKLIFVLKSTVPVGTADLCRKYLPESVAIVNNPEFLKEGTAVADFLRPERVVIGGDDEAARKKIAELYEPYVRSGAPILHMGNRSAELAKYAANSFLALKVSFINQLALLAENLGADVYDVRAAMVTDSRIGKQFLHPGAGYGGSCFPKDVQALAATGRDAGLPLPLVEATHAINERQREVIPNRILKFLAQRGCRPATVALWGIAFKPETDDIREAPALVLIDQLTAAGHRIQVYDPKALLSLERQRPELVRQGKVKPCGTSAAALDGADVLAVMTEWNEFRLPDFELIAAKLGKKCVFDGKNLYRAERLQTYGLRHYGIGFKAFDPN